MMLRRVNLLVLFGLIVGAVFIFGLTAGAQPTTNTGEDEFGDAQQRLAEFRMDAGAAYEAHSDAVFQLSELDGQIEAANEDLIVAEEDLGEAQGRLEERASTMYKSGNVGFVDVLIGAEDFSEFANRLELWVRLLARERAEFDRVREIRDTLAEKKAFLEATREERVQALGEADSQLDQASAFEADAQAYLDGLNAELRAALEAEQARQAEQAQAASEEQLRAELAAAEAEAVPASEAPKEASTPAAPEKTVRSEPVAVTVPRPAGTPEAVQISQPVEAVKPLKAAEPIEKTPEVDVAALQEAERLAAEQAAAEELAAEQAAAAERYAAEKAAAAEEAKLAAEQATAAQEQYAAEQAAEAQRRADLAAWRAATEQQAAAEQAAAEQAAAKQAAAQQAEAERLAAADQAEPQAAEKQQYANDDQEAADQQQYDAQQPQPQEALGSPAPEEEQYSEPAAPATQPAAGGSAPSSGGAASCGETYGGVAPHVAQIGCELQAEFGVAIDGVGSSGFHADGLSLDIWVSDTAFGDQILSTIWGRYSVNYSIWQQNYRDSAGYSYMQVATGNPTADHMDHIHVTFF